MSVSVYPLDDHFSRCGVFRSSPAKLHPPLKERWELYQTDPIHNIYVLVLFSLCSILTVIAVVVNQNDLFDQVRRAFLQDTEQTEKKYSKTHRGKWRKRKHKLGCKSACDLHTWPLFAAELSALHCGRWWRHWRLPGLTSTVYVCNCTNKPPTLRSTTWIKSIQ